MGPRQTAEALAVVVISNCGPNNKRNEWVQELMQYIKVDSYGRCFHNKVRPHPAVDASACRPHSAPEPASLVDGSRCSPRSDGGGMYRQEFPEASNNNWFSKKIDVLRPYKFYLAFDNTDSFDYVSEKFFHGLVAGSVPGTLALSLACSFAR